MAPNSVTRLLRGVSARAYLGSLGVAAYWALLITAGVYALLLILSRGFGLIPNYFNPWTVALIFPVALIAAFAARRPPKADQAARLVDSKMGTKDLFLTTTLIGNSAGEYQPLVTREAEEKARGIQPGAVVEYNWWPRTSTALTVAALLAVAAAFFPQLDPFGRQAERDKEQQRKDEIAKEKEKVEQKLAVFKEKPPTAEHSKAVESAIQELKRDFNEMKPTDAEGNKKKLLAQQKQVEGMYKQRLAEQNKQAADNKPLAQRFGGQNPKMEQWKDELAAGETTGLQKELQEIKEGFEQLQKIQDPAEKQQKKRELQEKLQDMEEFASDQAKSSGTSAALQQALKQLNMSDMKGLSQEAKDAMQSAMELSQAELEQLAQSARDMKSLEDAMKAIQSAKQANSEKPLDGGQCEGAGSLSDYQKLYDSMCQGGGQGEGEGMQTSGLGEGQGEGSGSGESDSMANGQGGFREGLAQGSGGGMGGPGQGRGGVAPENPDAKRDFQKEMSPSKMTAGKILMQMKTQGQADKGEVKQQYQEAVQSLKQNVNEAILTEQVPPGQQEVIKKYFGDMNDQTLPLPDAEKQVEVAPAPTEGEAAPADAPAP